MDRTIRIDDEVYMALQKGAEPFTDTPNSALRRILRLDQEQENGSDGEQSVYLVCSSSEEFESVQELQGFLKNLRQGSVVYLATTDHFWRNKADSVCLFHKKRHIVGEGKMNGKIRPYKGTKTSPVTGKPYAGEIDFIPNTIRLYKRPILFAEAEKALGREKHLAQRGMPKLNMADYSTISSIAAKDGFD